VIRISGDRAIQVLRTLGGPPPVPRRASRATLRDPETGEVLDEALVICFPGPSSFTGEDVVELHVHGGRSVLSDLVAVLGKQEGCRLAEAGEFTRRAFEHGKMDLTEVEGLADLIDAETAAQRRQALRQMDGALSDIYERWRQTLLQILSYFEASIDFSEEDIPQDLIEQTHRESLVLKDEIERHLADGRRGERVREGVRVAILGAPNVGKSSLLNALVRRDVAIVSEMEGTTRDIIEVQLDLGGYPVLIADTAGVRETTDSVERQGVSRALQRAREADIRLVLLDQRGLSAAITGLVDSHSILIANKADIWKDRPDVKIAGLTALGISAKSGEGIDVLLDVLEKAVQDRFPISGGASLTRARHRAALVECNVALDSAWSTDGGARGPELIAEDLRLACRALGRITGRVDVEDLLGKIFSDFCIGK